MEVVRTGTIVGGRYRAVRLAWPSAVGPVWHAKDTVLDRDVLLFTLAPDVASVSHATEALMAAAARSAALADAHVAQVYDCSADPPYLVSEMPAGGRLAERIADKPLPLRDAARIVVGVAAALRTIHDHGATHGAVGPAWIAIDEEGRAKLLGTGLADVAAIASAVRGAPPDPPLQPPGYPEAGADARSGDVRALAALALHMLAGKPPADGVAPKTRLPAPLAAAIERGVRGQADLPQIAAAFAPHAAPPAPAEREPGFMRTEGKWLAGVLLAVGAVVVIAIASVALVRRAPGGPEPTASPTPSATAIPVSAVRDFDPLGDGAEHTDQVGAAVDGNPTTAWFTFGYATANVGGKAGIGLLFDLGSSQRVGRIRVLSPHSGWQAQWRIADADAAKPDGYTVVGQFTASNDATAAIDPARQGRYWLLWITRLTDVRATPQYPFQAAVAEVQFLRA